MRFAFLLISFSSLPPSLAATVQFLSGIPRTNESVTANGQSGSASISRNGRFVTFVSDANDLIRGDQNGLVMDVFLKDLWSNSVVLVSVNRWQTNGGNQHSESPAVSEDGRWVVFQSEASDLVSGDTNGVSDVFLRDVWSNVTVQVSSPAVYWGPSRHPVLNPDGRFVAFESAAILATNDTDVATDIYLVDRLTGFPELVSIGLSALPNSNGLSRYECFHPRLSDDGRYVAFERRLDSAAYQVVVRDRLAGTFFISELPSNQVALNPSLSTNGSKVVFKVMNTGTDPLWVSYLNHDLVSGVGTIIFSNLSSSVWTRGHAFGTDTTGPTINGDASRVAFYANDSLWLWETNALRSLADFTIQAPAFDPQISLSGNEVIFLSSAPLISNSIPDRIQVYSHNLQSGQSRLRSLRPDGQGSSNDASEVSLSADGQQVVFASDDPGLVAGDDNQAADLFVSGGTNSVQLISRRGTTASSLTWPSLLSVGPFTTSSNSGAIFVSSAGSAAGYLQVYHRGSNGAVRLVSRNEAGQTANGNCTEASISGDGRFAVFTSSATNLWPNDTNQISDIFLADLTQGSLQMVSLDSAAPSGNQFMRASHSPLISGDGSVVVFRNDRIWVYNGSTYSIVISFPQSLSLSEDGSRLSIRHSGNSSTVYSTTGRSNIFTASGSFPVMSSSGRYLMTHSSLNGSNSLRLRDLSASREVFQLGVPSNSPPRNGSFSANDKFFVFQTILSLATADTNGLNDVYRCDLDRQIFELVSSDYTGTAAGSQPSEKPTISADGRHVVYVSMASNLVAGITPPGPSLYWKDMTAGSVFRVDDRSRAPFTESSLRPQFVPGNNAVSYLTTMRQWAGDENGSLDLYSFTRPGGAFVDSDADGLADDWEQTHFGNLQSEGGGDPDLDGQSNWAEFSSGTSPVDALSFLGEVRVINEEPVTLEWPAVAGYSYKIRFKNEITAAWEELDTPITVSGGRAFAIDFQTAASPRGFYQVMTIP